MSNTSSSLGRGPKTQQWSRKQNTQICIRCHNLYRHPIIEKTETPEALSVGVKHHNFCFLKVYCQPPRNTKGMQSIEVSLKSLGSRREKERKFLLTSRGHPWVHETNTVHLQIKRKQGHSGTQSTKEY